MFLDRRIDGGFADGRPESDPKPVDGVVSRGILG
jgi:hypothetical protein